jgi:hypothetical protein
MAYAFQSASWLQLVLMLTCHASGKHLEDVCAAEVGTSLLQTAFAVQVRQDHTGFGFADLFPSFQLEDLDAGFAASAKQAALGEPVWQEMEEDSPQEVPEFRKRVRMYNPSLFQTANGSTQLVARLSTSGAYCCGNTSLVCTGGVPDYNAVVKCQNESGIVECSRPLPGLEDPHGFTFNGRNYALANSYYMTWAEGESSNMTLVDLDTLTVSPLYLPNAAKCEKNWSPIVMNDELLMTYQISPNHIVLRCEIEKMLPGCEVAYSSATTLKNRGLSASTLARLSGVHGSTPYVELDDEHMLGLAHRYDQENTLTWLNETTARNTDVNAKWKQYWHSFYTIERRAPYRVAANTPWFQFPNLGSDGSAEWAGLQYAGGLMQGKEGEIVVSFGVGDCKSRSLRLHVSDVKRALSA